MLTILRTVLVLLCMSAVSCAALEREPDEPVKVRMRKAVRAALRDAKAAPEPQTRREIIRRRLGPESEAATAELIQQILYTEGEDLAYLRVMLRELDSAPESLVAARLKSQESPARRARLLELLSTHRSRLAVEILASRLDDTEVCESLPTEVQAEGPPRRVCDLAHDILAIWMDSEHFPVFTPRQDTAHRTAQVERLRTYWRANPGEMLKRIQRTK